MSDIDLKVRERAEKAVELKQHGYNCSQSVVTVLADQTGLTEDVLCQLAAGFCAGMGTMDATCGALIGAGMIAGLKTSGKGTLQKTKKICERFEALSGAVTCADLKGRDTGKVLCPCPDCVRHAVIAYSEVMGLE